MFKGNIIAETLKIAYPIIQAPMLGVSTPEMAAVVSNEGGLGSLAVGGLSPEVTKDLIHKTKSLTDKPFAVNLFVHDAPDYKEADIEQMRELLLRLAHERGYALDAADLTGFRHYTYYDQLDILIQEGISLISFTFGCLDKEAVTLLKEKGCTLMGTATCVEEALLLQERDIDMIIVQGIEAGGHRGTFLEDIPLPEVGLFTLLPQVKRTVNKPCIAAGGIHSGATINAAFELGADAVQIGTAFIGTEESAAIAAYKERLKSAKDTDTTLTRAFSGRWARGIRNEMMEAIEQSGIAIPPYPIHNSLTGKLRKLAQQKNDGDYTNLWAGQACCSSDLLHTKDVFRDMVKQYES